MQPWMAWAFDLKKGLGAVGVDSGGIGEALQAAPQAAPQSTLHGMCRDGTCTPLSVRRTQGPFSGPAVSRTARLPKEMNTTHISSEHSYVVTSGHRPHANARGGAGLCCLAPAGLGTRPSPQVPPSAGPNAFTEATVSIARHGSSYQRTQHHCFKELQCGIEMP